MESRGDDVNSLLSKCLAMILTVVSRGRGYQPCGRKILVNFPGSSLRYAEAKFRGMKP